MRGGGGPRRGGGGEGRSERRTSLEAVRAP
nr:MAG TPA: hypothetical protein [Caudoviricetes sp.]